MHINSFADTRDWLLSAASVRHSVVTHLALRQQGMAESIGAGLLKVSASPNVPEPRGQSPRGMVRYYTRCFLQKNKAAVPIGKP